tara:strand:- start:24 stop:206 length:183 start_codon:yes stop_codon:yes gene_type:complete
VKTVPPHLTKAWTAEGQTSDKESIKVDNNFIDAQVDALLQWVATVPGWVNNSYKKREASM